jgi:hypothetical protein
MTLCYDFQKWTIVSLASVMITLIIGLMVVYGQGWKDPSYMADG